MGKGERAEMSRMLARWGLTWLPLILLSVPVGFLIAAGDSESAFFWAWFALLLWLSGAFHTAMSPGRGLHDRLAGTWVVRR